MSDQFKLKLAQSDDKIKSVLGLVSEGFTPQLTKEQSGSMMLQSLKEAKDEKSQVFYLEQKSTGNPACIAQIVHTPGFYKDADKSGGGISSTPNPELFGVKHVTMLRLTSVVTANAFRNLGLANKLIVEAMKYIEEEIFKTELENSNPKKQNNFKDMVTADNGKVDHALAKYYLGKKYFWVLYSGVGKYYERFGFKGFPIEAYKIPTSIVDHQKATLDTLLGTSGNDPMAMGKKLKLLDYTNAQDRDLVSFVLQGKELEILTELNKLIFHSELSGGRKSSSSLTNMTELLGMTKITSENDLTSVSEAPKSSGQKPSVSSGRRKSSIHHHNVPKVAVKPTMDLIQSRAFFHKGKFQNSDLEKFDNIEGAIFTNDLQQKSHYILWANLSGHFVIIAVGELQFNMFGAMADPLGKGGHKPRRGSSFTGLNELGGYNFQDLDILFSVACLACQNRSGDKKSSVYVAVNDLPNSIPAPMLNDYFLNYLPKAFDSVEASDSENVEKRVEFIANASDTLEILPMIRRYGQDSPNFELDWVANGLWSYS